MKKYLLTGLSVTGGLLSGLAWSDWCSGIILLISLVPFFIIENWLFENRKNYSPNAFFIYLLPGFLIFSLLTLGWLRIASMVGAITVIMGITFILSFTVWLAHLCRLYAGNLISAIALISFWLCYEYISLNVDIVTPWANLGNGFAKDITLIQWYEITGTPGGTLWILLSNITLSAFIIKSDFVIRKRSGMFVIWLMVIIIPSALSLKRYYSVKEATEKESEIVIIQPNFDPYTTKFSIPFKQQLEKSLLMAESAATSKTEWIITPETTVDDPVNENETDKNNYTGMVRGLVRKYPDACVVTGMTTFILYRNSSERPTKSARFVDSINTYYDHYNSALKIDTSPIIEIYHKSKLVPGIEKQFLTGPGKILGRILPYLGGSQWGYGSQDERSIFSHPVTGIKAAPIICYESVFGEYITDYVKKGANLLFIITNDGWWKNTSGYKQHLSFASLRAIETRRPVARSGNTGVSAFIDIRGKVINKTEWWTQATLKGKLAPETNLTPYVKWGDWLLKAGTISTLIIILIVFPVAAFRRKKKYSRLRVQPMQKKIVIINRKED